MAVFNYVNVWQAKQGEKMQPNLNGSLESLLADKAMHQTT